MAAEQSEPRDADLIQLLAARDGSVTHVELLTGVLLQVINIAWGYDEGDECAHVTTNISPAMDARPWKSSGRRTSQGCRTLGREPSCTTEPKCRYVRPESVGVELQLEDGLALVYFAGEPEAVLQVEGDG